MLPVGLEPEESISQGTRDQLPRLLHMKVMGEDTPERLGQPAGGPPGGGRQPPRGGPGGGGGGYDPDDGGDDEEEG